MSLVERANPGGVDVNHPAVLDDADQLGNRLDRNEIAVRAVRRRANGFRARAGLVGRFDGRGRRSGRRNAGSAGVSASGRFHRLASLQGRKDEAAISDHLSVVEIHKKLVSANESRSAPIAAGRATRGTRR